MEWEGGAIVNFYQWVKTFNESGLIEEDSGPMSDFVDDTLRVPDFPREGNLEKVEDYFSYKLRGNKDCQEAARLLIALYRECWSQR